MQAAQSLNVEFVESYFVSRMHFIVHYLMTKNGPLNKNRFRIQCNLAVVRRVWENMRNSLAPIFISTT
jgi:hypothetical protein